MTFDPGDPRGWARQHLRGCANVVLASYSEDTSRLNEAGIRHDVARAIDLGFTGTLAVAETVLTLDEYAQFVEMAVDEAAGRLSIIFHAAFGSLAENIEAARRSRSAGAELALLGYPASFYPRDNREIVEHTKAFCAATELGVILFPVPLWGFERLHPASIAPESIVELVRDVPNIVAIKAEGGMPSIAGFTHVRHLVGEEVIVTFPVEEQGIPLATLVPIQWMGTSCMEYYGDAVPRMLALAQHGDVEETMNLYWRISPARRAAAQGNQVVGSNFVHRYLWKYMAWLQGFNGGPLRSPTMRIVGSQMNALRAGLEAAGLSPTTSEDWEFFVGRHPC
jgi:4-hydroxy-tetrahydrodipicolinate synthase